MAESQSIEYKSSWRDEYLKWVCGFANAKGGTLYVGIADDGSVTGLPDARRLLEDIPNKIISGLGIVAAVMLHETRQGSYLEIEVEAQAFPVSYKGQYYVRVGATNQLLSGTALDTFLLRKQGQSWDAAPVPGVKSDNLSIEAIKRFVERAQGKGRVPDEALTEDPDILVRHLRLDRDGYLTNAAVLLFHPEPDRFVPGCSVKIGYFEGPEILYQDEIAGPVIGQPDEVIDLLYTKYLKAKITYDGIRRVERYPFPLPAVREAVVNAIVHKNYQSGAPIQIRVYEDRLIVANSCILPEGWSVESLLSPHASEPHNPKIANVFFLAGHIESWGRGVQKIITECKLDGIDAPRFSTVGNSISLEFEAPRDRIVIPGGQDNSSGLDIASDETSLDKGDPCSNGSSAKTGKASLMSDKPSELSDKSRSVSDKTQFSVESSSTQTDKSESMSDKQSLPEAERTVAETQVLQFIGAHGEVRSTEIADLLEVTQRSAARFLGRLVEQGLVETSGANKNRRYRISAENTRASGQEADDGR